MVYVQDIKGKPLMPTQRHGKVKWLLRTKKAVVVQLCPFTIRMTYESTYHVQSVSLGIDAGSKTIGISATTERRELYAAELTLRNDIIKLLATRREFRRARRNRKTRYRQPRFDNRVGRKKRGWLAPSIEHKIETHIKAVDAIHRILPISRIVIEVAQFDMQKIKNLYIQGEEYQQGEQLGFWNVRNYVLYRDGHKCQYCSGKSKDPILNVHHIQSRKIGGDAPNNLLTLCETCHDKYHKGEITLKVKRGKSLRDAAFMGIMRWTFYNRLKEQYSEVYMTYGYITKCHRVEHGLEKSHKADARCISGNPTAEPVDSWYMQKTVRHHNRQLHKTAIGKGGMRRANQSAKVVKGFRLFDKVLYEEQKCFIFGKRTSGFFDLRLLDGAKVHASANCAKLKLIEMQKTLLTQRMSSVNSSLHLKMGVSLTDFS